MTTATELPSTMERLIEANKNLTTTLAGQTLHTQEQSMQIGRRMTEAWLQSGESWQNDQRNLLNSSLGLVTSSQTSTLQLARALLDATLEPQETARRTNDAVLRDVRRAADAWQDLTMSWLRFASTAFLMSPVSVAMPNGRAEDYRYRAEEGERRSEARTRAEARTS